MNKYETKLLELIKDVKSWEDLKPKLVKINKSNSFLAGKLFEYFTKNYFLTDPIKTEEYCNVWLHEEIPLSIKESLNFIQVEHGVDLLLKTNVGEYLAVQCKFKNDESKSLNWNSDKVANLFAYASMADGFIIVSNTSSITKVASKKSNFQFIKINDLLKIEESTFENIQRKLNGKTLKKYKKPVPYDFQKTAIEDILKKISKEKRTQLILPCGAGKTLTSLWIKEKLNPKNTLILVPSLALLKQTKEEWLKNRNSKFEYICICSDKTIDEGADIPMLEVFEIGGRIVNSPKHIVDFYKINMNKVFFCTYQSLKYIEKAISIYSDIHFDLIICDEAHRTAGSKQGSEWTIVHDNKKIPAKRRLYMTATPKVASYQLKAKYGDDLKFLCDMSNSNIFGMEGFRMSFGEAIDKKILVDYKILAIGVKDKEVEQLLKERRLVTTKETIEDYAHNYALSLVMKKYSATHCVTFHSRVKYAEAFCIRNRELFPNVFARHVSGKQSSSKRSNILRDFRNSKIAIASNSRCLTEGVDLPKIDLVYFSDPKSSKIDIVQAVGRALRTAKSKEIGYVVVPILHNEEEEIERAIGSSLFQNLINIIRSLCDQDERLQSEINHIAFSKKGKISNVEFDFGESQLENIVKIQGFKEKLKSALFQEIIKKNVDSWELRFSELKQYISENGHCHVPARYKKNPPLTTWVIHQRVKRRKKKLSQDKINRLNQIGFKWDYKFKFNWEDFFTALKKYKIENGILPNVNQRGKDYYAIIFRVIKQKKRKGELSEDQIIALDNLGFIWDKREIIWMDRYNELLQYYQNNNSFHINSKNTRLYSWVQRQRKNYKKGVLSSDKIKRLEEINFIWNNLYSNRPKTIKSLVKPKQLSRKAKWRKSFEELKEFKKKHDHLKLNKKEKPKLAKWINDQRSRYRKEKISQDSIDLLNSIDFNWESPTSKNLKLVLQDQKSNILSEEEIEEILWNKMFSDLHSHFILYGNLKINRSKNSPLNYWISKQRKLYHQNKLSELKIKKLNSLRFTWDKPIRKSDWQIWKSYFNKVVEFKKQKGHMEVSQKEDKKLYNWLRNQRTAYKKGMLKEERIIELNKIGYDLNSRSPYPRDKKSLIIKWEEMFSQLVEYKKIFGNVNVSQKKGSYYILGRWVNTQRTKKKRQKLKKEKEDRLNDLGFIWDMKEYLFEKKIEALKKFHIENGHFDLSKNKELRLWRNQIRSRGVSRTLFERLSQIGYIDDKINIKE